MVPCGNSEINISLTQLNSLKPMLRGKQLLNDATVNKGTAFTAAERVAFALHGKLPSAIETLDQQVERAYVQYQKQTSNANKSIFLQELYATNCILFYKLVTVHIAEILPILYTPEVANTVINFSHDFRRPHGLYVSYAERDHLDAMFANYETDAIDLIVVTDGEGVLGIGDQGIGAIHIPIAKLILYTVLGGINPLRVLPIVLDVGTNNQSLLYDPLYLGWRQPRLTGVAYDEFIDYFVTAIKHKFPRVFLHWEDFGRDNAASVLTRYRDKICSFNDDLQGTAVVTVAALLAALKVSMQDWREQRIVIFGAGTSGVGIAEQIIVAMQYAGMTKEEAYRNVWLIDRQGLLLTNTLCLTPAQRAFVHHQEEINHWQLNDENFITLGDVVKNLHPTILLGCSAQHGLFTEEIIRDMAQHTLRPIIFLLSNPIDKCEAIPENVIKWTDGKAIVATGSPFAPVIYQDKIIPITQCNNALAFPGIGMGVIASRAQKLTDAMLWMACQALLATSPVIKQAIKKQSADRENIADHVGHKDADLLLPPLADAASVALEVASAVMLQAQREQQEKLCSVENLVNVVGATTGVMSNLEAQKFISKQVWVPEYSNYVE